MAESEVDALLERELETGAVSDNSLTGSNRYRVGVAAGFGLASVGLAVGLSILAAFVGLTWGGKAPHGIMSDLEVISESEVSQGTSQAHVPSGTYVVKNVASNLFLNVADSIDIESAGNGASLQTWTGGHSGEDVGINPRSKWWIFCTGTGGEFNIQYDADRSYSMSISQDGDRANTNVQFYYDIAYNDIWCKDGALRDNMNEDGSYASNYSLLECEELCSQDKTCNFITWGSDSNGYNRCATFETCEQRDSYEAGDPSVYRKMQEPIVQLRDDLRSDTQWKFLRVGNSSHYLIQSARGRFFLGTEGNPIGSTVIMTRDDPPGSRFHWQLELVAVGNQAIHRGPTPEGTSLAYPLPSTYNIMKPATDLGINVAAGSRSREARVQLHDNKSLAGTQWTLSTIGWGIYNIQSVRAATQYLNVAGGGRAPEYEKNVQLYNNPLSPDSQFAFYEDLNKSTATHKYYLIKNIATQMYLTASVDLPETDVLVASIKYATRWVMPFVGFTVAYPTRASTTCDGLQPHRNLPHWVSCPSLTLAAGNFMTSLPRCTEVLAGDLCEGDGTCDAGEGPSANNCGQHSVYIKEIWAQGADDRQFIILRKRFLCSDGTTVHLQPDANESCYWAFERNHERRLEAAPQTNQVTGALNGLGRATASFINCIKDVFNRCLNNNAAEEEEDGRRLTGTGGLTLVPHSGPGTQWRMTEAEDNNTDLGFEALQSAKDNTYLVGNEDGTCGTDPDATKGAQVRTPHVQVVRATPRCNNTDGQVALRFQCVCGSLSQGPICDAGDFCSLYSNATSAWYDRCSRQQPEAPHIDCESSWDNCKEQYCEDANMGCNAYRVRRSQTNSSWNPSGSNPSGSNPSGSDPSGSDPSGSGGQAERCGSNVCGRNERCVDDTCMCGAQQGCGTPQSECIPGNQSDSQSDRSVCRCGEDADPCNVGETCESTSLVRCRCGIVPGGCPTGQICNSTDADPRNHTCMVVIPPILIVTNATDQNGTNQATASNGTAAPGVFNIIGDANSVVMHGPTDDNY